MATSWMKYKVTTNIMSNLHELFDWHFIHSMQKDQIIAHTPQLNLNIVLRLFEHVWKLKNVTYLWTIYVVLFKIKHGRYEHFSPVACDEGWGFR